MIKKSKLIIHNYNKRLKPTTHIDEYNIKKFLKYFFNIRKDKTNKEKHKLDSLIINLLRSKPYSSCF